MAQTCHACTAVTHLFYQDPNTQAYLADLDNMHKCVLEVFKIICESFVSLGLRNLVIVRLQMSHPSKRWQKNLQKRKLTTNCG